MRMASGLAMTTSKSIWPALTFSARSSKPTTSAPAALAASAFLPWVNTATRTVLPVPCGITVEPRTCWSDLVASTPKFTDTSTDSLNFAVANSLTSLRASSMAYDLPGANLSFQVLVRFAVVAMLETPFHVDAHAARGAGNRPHAGLQVAGREVGRLQLRDVLELLARDLAHFCGVRRGAALRAAERLGDQYRRRRRLHDEGETAIAVHRDHDRSRQALLQRLGLRVERLAEFHDIHALLAQGRPDRRTRVRLACRDLQLDIAGDFLRHLTLLWVQAPPSLSGSSPCVQALARQPNYMDARAPTFNGADAAPSDRKINLSRPARNPIPRASSIPGSARPPAAGSSRNSPTRRLR